MHCCRSSLTIRDLTGPVPVRNVRGMIVAIVAILLALGASSQRTRTVTQVPTPDRLSLERTDFSAIEFVKPFLFPAPYFGLRMANNTFDITSHPDCKLMLATSSVVGDPWETQLLSPARVTPKFELIEVRIPGVGGDAERVELQPAPYPNRVQLGIRGIPTFNAEDGNYDIEVPAVCTTFGSSPNVVTFTIAKQARSPLGRAMTYIHYVAAGAAVFSLLTGSMTALMPLQQFALINNCGCLPIKLQEEAIVESYTLSPLQFSDALMTSTVMKLGTSLALVGGLWFLEGFHWLFLATKRSKIRAAEAAKRKEQEDSASGEKSPSPEQDKGSNNSSPDEKSEKKDPNKSLTDVDAPSRKTEAEFTTVQAPFIAIAATIGMINGIVHHSLHVVFENDNRYLQLMGVAGIATHGLLPIVGAVGIGRIKSFIFIPYRRSSKGSIPRWLQPGGVWGPNFLRLSLGIFVEDFNKSKRLFAVIILLHQFIMTFIASTSPDNEGSCRNTLWFGLVTNTVFLTIMYYTRPFRSKFMNNGYSALQALFTLYYGMLTLWGGYQHVEDHWSHQGIFAIGVAFNVAAILYNGGILYVAKWEIHKGRACRHVTQNIEATNERQNVDTTEDIVNQMVELFQQTNEENLEAEMLRNQLVPLEEDDTAAVRFYTEKRSKEPQVLTLADYLLQDAERLPADTKVQFHLEQQLHLERQKSKHKLLTELSVHPSMMVHKRNNPNYIEPREKPRDILTFTPHRERQIPAAFLSELEEVRRQREERSESVEL